MKLEITMNEKQIKEACLEVIKEKFHGLKMQFDIKSYELGEDGLVSLKVLAEEIE